MSKLYLQNTKTGRATVVTRETKTLYISGPLRIRKSSMTQALQSGFTPNLFGPTRYAVLTEEQYQLSTAHMEECARNELAELVAAVNAEVLAAPVHSRSQWIDQAWSKLGVSHRRKNKG